MRGLLCAALLLYCLRPARAAEPNILARLEALRVPALKGKTPAYYSQGFREHAQKLQGAIEDMKVFYQRRLGVQADLPLALLNAEDWKRVTGNDYSLPQVAGEPSVILMPATSDNAVYGLMDARKAAIPPGELQAFLHDHHTTFDAVAADFVDFLGFHELGHVLVLRFGIDPQNIWFNEFLATYLTYVYVSERQAEWKSAYALLGRPSKRRPQNTSLEDFERLYSRVDDYGWYQGMIEVRIRELAPLTGLRFLRDLKRTFPLQPGSKPWDVQPLDTRMKPAALLEQLEKIAPGFQKWAEGFRSAPS